MRIESNSGAPSAPRTSWLISKPQFQATPPRAPQAESDARRVQSQLGAAWSVVVGSPPPARAIAILTAHWALETNGGRAMPGHNFAGIKAAPTAPGEELCTVEGYSPPRSKGDNHPLVSASAEQGTQNYVHLLATHFPAALEAAHAGNAPAFARALAKGHYFTADPAAYAAGLQQRLSALESAISPTAVQAPGALAQMALAGVLGALCERQENA